jgi:hypothetical protein
MLLVSGLRRRPVSSRFSLTIQEKDETRYVSRRGLEDKFTECREMNAGWDAKQRQLWILIGPDVCDLIAERSFAFTLLLSGEKVSSLHLPPAVFEAGPPDLEPLARSVEKGVPAEASVPPHGAPVMVAETTVRPSTVKVLPPPPPPPPDIDVESLPEGHRPPPLAPVVVGVVAVLGAAMGVAYLLTSGPSTPPAQPASASAPPPAAAKPVVVAEVKPPAPAAVTETKPAASEAKPAVVADTKPAAPETKPAAEAKPSPPAASVQTQTTASVPAQGTTARTVVASGQATSPAAAAPTPPPADAHDAKSSAGEQPRGLMLASTGSPQAAPAPHAPEPVAPASAAAAPTGCGAVASPATLAALPPSVPSPDAFCIAHAWSQAGRLDDALVAYASLQKAGYVPAMLELAKLYDPLSHRDDLSPVPDFAREEYQKVIQEAADDTIRQEAKRRLDALDTH